MGIIILKGIYNCDIIKQRIACSFYCSKTEKYFTLRRGNNELNELTLSLQKNATQSHKC